MSENTMKSNEVSPETPKPKLPTCRLSSLSGILFLVLPLLIVLSAVLETMEEDVSNNVKMIILVIGAVSLIGSPFAAAAAKVRIALSEGCLDGSRLANLILIVSQVMLLLTAGFTMSSLQGLPERILCGANLRGLATAMTVYANSHDGQLPPEDQWCDVLIAEMDVSPASFVCRASDAVKGESCYALNKFAAGKKLSELPPDMVLLFETHQGAEGVRDYPFNEREFVKKIPGLKENTKVRKGRWNQVGGPENFYGYHSQGALAVYVNGKTEYLYFLYPSHIRAAGLGKLVWDENGTTFKIGDYTALGKILNRPVPTFPNSVVALAVAVAAAGLIVIIFTQAWRYWLFCILLAAGAVGIGNYFGVLAENTYRPEFFKGAGGIGGAFMGGWMALCYVGFLMRYQKPLMRDTSVRQLAIAMGLLTGMLCSILLHSMLMLIHREHPGVILMVLGLPFGILGGLLLGALSGWIVLRFYRRKTVETGYAV